MSGFNEVDLLRAVYRQWGEFGAHAEVLRTLIKSSGLEIPDLDGPLAHLPQHMVDAIAAEPSRVVAAKIARSYGNMGLLEALALVDEIRRGAASV